MVRYFQFVFLLVSLLAVLVACWDDVSEDREAQEIDNNWNKHTAKHRKRYNGKEHKKRKEHFAKRHKSLKEHNAKKNPTFHVDHNGFSDWHPEEFEKLHGFMPSNTSRMMDLPVYTADDREDIPASFDLRKDPKYGKCVGAIKNQLCGCCWAFSTIASMEYNYCKSNGGDYTLLSEQQLVDCDSENAGCNGGDPYYAFSYIYKAGGSETAASYGPHTGKDGVCHFNVKSAPITAVRFGRVGKTVKDIQSAVMKYGTISATLYAGSTFTGELNADRTAWLIHFYKQGVYSEPTCAGKEVNHAVNIIGWGTDTVTGKDYWIIRNSWNAGWGQEGYAWIERGTNMCGIESYLNYVEIGAPGSSPTTLPPTTTEASTSMSSSTDEALSSTPIPTEEVTYWVTDY